ncbi:MAG: phosphatidylserine decarboxylase [Chloroflexi bacterium]|nr:phosphatidylserine decarboxylase [Chloroflexota bacterium]
MPNDVPASLYTFRIPGLDPEATPIVGLGIGLAGLFLGLRPRLVPWPLALTAAAAVLYRDPERATPMDDGALFAPADGLVAGTAELYEHRFLHTDALQLSIDVSPLDVAVQRSPATGTIEYLDHRMSDVQAPWRWHIRGGRAGEQLFVGIATDWGPLLLQITAGTLTAKMTPLVTSGDRVHAGDRIAVVRFGCRVDLLAPRDLIEWKPAPGARLRAGVSPIGQVVPL